MVNKLKTYAVLTLLVFGLVFLGIGCTGNDSGESQVEETSSAGATEAEVTSDEAPEAETSSTESQSISLKGSDTVLPLAQAEAEEFHA